MSTNTDLGASAVPARTACPDPALVAALADGALDAEAREPVVQHVASCEPCLDDLGALVRLARDSGPAVPARLLEAARQIVRGGGASVSHPPRTPSWRPVLAVAATVMLSVGAWYYVQRNAFFSPATSSSISDDPVRSSQPVAQVPLVVRPPDRGRLQPGAIDLEWRPTAAAIAYRVRVMRDDGQLLWERETAATTIEIPEAASLPTAVPLYVAVTAVLPDGKTTRAPAVRFEIVP
jgi:hypothetical protein